MADIDDLTSSYLHALDTWGDMLKTTMPKNTPPVQEPKIETGADFKMPKFITRGYLVNTNTDTK